VRFCHRAKRSGRDLLSCRPGIQCPTRVCKVETRPRCRSGSTGRGTGARHAQVDLRTSRGGPSHVLELLLGGGQAGFQALDLAEPAVLGCLVDARHEVGDDLPQPWLLGRVGAGRVRARWGATTGTPPPRCWRVTAAIDERLDRAQKVAADLLRESGEADSTSRESPGGAKGI
jgi:hypothetical protein